MISDVKLWLEDFAVTPSNRELAWPVKVSAKLYYKTKNGGHERERTYIVSELRPLSFLRNLKRNINEVLSEIEPSFADLEYDY
jgi:hypothetical protein